MKWLVILFVIMFLIGSVMWVRPTPRQRFQARLREQARRDGFQVRLVQLELPRAQGEVGTTAPMVACYSLPRTNLTKPERLAWSTWSVAKVDSLNNEGLPEGWCWRQFPEGKDIARVEAIHQHLTEMPTEVIAIDSTPVQLSVYWRESETLPLEKLAALMKQILQQKI